MNSARDSADAHLIWIDLEMTGLDPVRDVILEIAVIVTDSNLHEVAQGPHRIIHHADEKLNHMSEWVKKQHTASGLIDAVRASASTLALVEQELVTFLRPYCQPNPGILAGNSIWQDRSFLQASMPRILELMHYRMIDVSSFKEMIKRWYPESPYATIKKADMHRAVRDIRESIQELRTYRQHFFVKQ